MKRPPTKRRKQGERGFALLLVFLMASAVALMLYMQVPREAFESERDKEQMLIDRGEQYKRAIYMYYVSNNRAWPARIEDLESTNNKRYLRHRYINPYTGKDEWRLIHTNGAFLTDSLVTPPPAQPTPGAGGALAGGALAGGAPPGGALPGGLGGGFSNTGSTIVASSTDPNAPPEVNAQVRSRPSDRALVQNSSFQNPGGGASFSGNDPGYQPFNPSSLPPISLYPNGYNAPPNSGPGQTPQGAPIQTGFNFNPVGTGGNQAGVNQPGVNQPGVNQPGVNQGATPGPPGVIAPGFSVPGINAPVANAPGLPPNFNQPGFNQPVINQPAPVQPGGVSFPPGGVNFPPGVVQPGGGGQFQPNLPVFNGPAPGGAIAPTGGPPNQAVNLINQLLTTPRQPPPGVGPNQSANGGGLAGVASVFKGASIKRYGDREKYEEWEFVFQLTQQGGLQAPVGVGPNGPGGPNGPTNQNGPNGSTGVPGSLNGFGGGTGGAGGGVVTPGFGSSPTPGFGTR